nr:MAG TPA: hypothetical protein [Caudoviricetes sp.]DAR73117.1 MAG TPA: hypothetical protein [Caudoviricetes sp.]DAU43896.1 MAG TPA: hypothetical protein [Caudoviricetes sp.]
MSENVLMTLIPAISAILTVWIQAGRKRDADDINSKINQVQSVVNEITEIGKKNNEDITKLNNGILTIERYRLEEDLQRALKRGYTTNEEVRRLSELYGSYSGLHGNGYIGPLFERFLQLPVKG